MIERQRLIDRHDRRGRQQRLFGQRPDTHSRPHRAGGALGVGTAVGVVVGVHAQLGLATQAMRAGSARHEPRQHDVLARADGGDVVAHFGDDPGALVTERAWQQRRDGPVAQRQVAVAHAAGGQLHPDLVATERPQRELLHRCGLPDLAQHHRLHAKAPVIDVIPTYDGGTTAPGQGGRTMTATSAEASATSATLTIGGEPQPGAARELPGAQPGPAGRDRRVCAGRRPRPARRRGAGGAAGRARVARARRRRAGRRHHRGRHHGRRPTRRQRRRAAVHPRARQGARRGALRDRHRAGAAPQSSGRSPRRRWRPNGSTRSRPTHGCSASRTEWRRWCCRSTGRWR